MPEPIVFADPSAVAARLGRAAFESTETMQVTALLATAASLIVEAVDRTDAWAADLIAADLVPSAFVTTSIEVAARVMQNPRGVRSQGETLGAHSRQESFADRSLALELTPGERRRVRRAAGLPATGSAPVGSVLGSVARDLGQTGLSNPVGP